MLAVTLLALALLGQEPGPPSGEEPRIGIGDSVTARLEPTDPPLPGHGPSKRWRFAPTVDASVTITLDSHDFNAFLRVETGTGEKLAEDDDGGVETNARVVLDARAGEEYRIAATAPRGEAGELRLAIHPGRSAVPSGAARLDAAIAFHARAAERALERGEKQRAWNHRMEEGARRLDRGQFDLARTAWSSALALAGELRDPAREAAALGSFGILYRTLGEYGKAREYSQADLRMSLASGDRAGEARAVGNLGTVYGCLGDYEKARDHFVRHLALARELRDREGEAKAHSNLGIAYRSLGDYEKAREHQQSCLVLSRALSNREGEVRALMNLGVVCFSLGDFGKAREFFDSALESARASGFRTHVAALLGNLASLHHALGEFFIAKELYQKQLALARELGDASAEAHALAGLGIVAQSLGDYDQAREHHEAWLSLARARGDRAAEASALGNLGQILHALEDYAQAREHAQAGLARARELRNRRMEAQALATLGRIANATGDPAKARECFERQLSPARESGDRESEGIALGNLAAVHRSLGDLPSARQAARAALNVLEEVPDEEHRLGPLAVLALVCGAEGDVATAREALGEARDLLDRRGSLTGLRIEEASGLRSRHSFWGEVAQDTTTLLLEPASDAAARTRIVSEGFQDAGRWKGRALLEGIVEHRAGARSREAIRLRREAREALASRDRILARVSEAVRAEKLASTVSALRAEALSWGARADALEARLREVSPRDTALDLPSAATPEAVRRALPEGTALIEYADGEKRLHAFLLTAQDLRRLDLGERQAIDQEVGAFLRGIARPGSFATIADLGRRLFDRLLAPVLADAGSRVGRLLVVPTASLAGLPFEALVAGARASAPRDFADLEFVLDRYEVGYCPASSVLVELSGQGPRREPGGTLILADPVYAGEKLRPEDASPVAQVKATAGERGIARVVPRANDLGRLPRTRHEALGLAHTLLARETDEARRKALADELAALGDRRSGAVAAPGFDLCLGFQAARWRLEGDLRGYEVLHLAAHGHVDPEFPQKTWIAVSARPGEDGYLALADVLELDLDANLVALSACDTARGKALRGEGIESLARAFLYAGARAVVASLWQVDDAAAAETMTRFYREPPSARALRSAKLAVRKGGLPPESDQRGIGSTSPSHAAPADRGHPYYWAAFIYIGAPR